MERIFQLVKHRKNRDWYRTENTISISQLFDYVSFVRNVIVKVFVRFSNENNNQQQQKHTNERRNKNIHKIYVINEKRKQQTKLFASIVKMTNRYFDSVVCVSSVARQESECLICVHACNRHTSDFCLNSTHPNHNAACSYFWTQYHPVHSSAVLNTLLDTRKHKFVSFFGFVFGKYWINNKRQMQTNCCGVFFPFASASLINYWVKDLFSSSFGQDYLFNGKKTSSFHEMVVDFLEFKCMNFSKTKTAGRFTARAKNDIHLLVDSLNFGFQYTLYTVYRLEALCHFDGRLSGNVQK